MEHANVTENVLCPACGGNHVVKCGKSAKSGLQRYRCQEESCSVKTFQLEYPYHGCWERFTPIPTPKVWKIRPFVFES